MGSIAGRAALISRVMALPEMCCWFQAGACSIKVGARSVVGRDVALRATWMPSERWRQQAWRQKSNKEMSIKYF